MSDVKEIGESGFQADVIDSALPVLVDFYRRRTAGSSKTG